MCECGCGELHPIAKLPAGDGSWYLLEVYPGCQDCGTSWGLGVTLIRETDDEWEYHRSVPTAEFGPYGNWGTQILNTEILKKLFMESTGDDDDLSETNFAFSEFVSRDGLRSVFHETRKHAE